MKSVTSAEFIKGIRGTDGIVTDGIPQVAFVGRSNVGKSSVINSLVNRKSLVKVGKKPGKTTEINFFSINNGECYFVDLPGYGFAKLDLKGREKIRKLILWYLADSGARPQTVALILDAKVGITDFDREMLEVLRAEGHPYVIVANKMDKLNQKEAQEAIWKIKDDSREEGVVPYSAETKKGLEILLARLG